MEMEKMKATRREPPLLLQSCSGQGAAPERAEYDEETRCLAPSFPARRSRRRRRGRLGQPAAESEWKPSLCAIAEDNAMVVMMEKEKAGCANDSGSEAQRSAKRKSGSGAGVHVRSYGDDYGRTHHIPTVIPAFAPTPFMF
ncbi:uncharacterized protein LOC121234868 [Juglans microcarpa x Juglans regia]|uniref:uncharacterized protein LOC121234868 n=1 Tax=Juglans microcarpa x Juglans regia TaxID=2249226 RepID=UPI001B7DF4F3|nr:uncharacterized protein LOC121234868 [Juglans microcarpa x Juglans regia]